MPTVCRYLGEAALNRLEKAQRLGYLNDTTNIEIDEQDVPYSPLLLESLADFGDYYVDDEWQFDQEVFNSYVDLEFPGYKNLLKCIGLFHSGALARAKRARSGAPWVRKFGKPSIPENLVMT